MTDEALDIIFDEVIVSLENKNHKNVSTLHHCHIRILTAAGEPVSANVCQIYQNTEQEKRLSGGFSKVFSYVCLFKPGYRSRSIDKKQTASRTSPARLSCVMTFILLTLHSLRASSYSVRLLDMQCV